jgi:hypothetical protein
LKQNAEVYDRCITGLKRFDPNTGDETKDIGIIVDIIEKFLLSIGRVSWPHPLQDEAATANISISIEKQIAIWRRYDNKTALFLSAFQVALCYGFHTFSNQT